MFMWRRRLFRGGIIVFTLLLIGAAFSGGALAQDGLAITPTETPTVTPSETPQPTATTAPQVIVNDVQPAQLTAGVGGLITITGANFSDQARVLLNGSIPLAITGQSDGALTATVGSSVPAGTYTVQVNDPVSGVATASNTLAVLQATQTPQITVSHAEPSQVTSGQAGTLSVLGANFTESTTVRLIGYGLLQTTFVNGGALTASVPANLPPGEYGIEVSDPARGTVSAPNSLRAVAPQVTAQPTVVPTATVAPTPVPGQPELVIRNFNAAPSTIYPGGTTQLTFEVVNVGSRTAEGVVVSIGDTNFAPANGQSGVIVPDLGTGASYTVSLGATAPMDAAEGAHNIPIVMVSRDFSGQTYTDNATVSVSVATIAEGSSQVVLDSYTIEPNTAAPGDEVILRALFRNTGSATAEQVLVQLNGENSVLLGSGGDSFAIGDMPAGAVAPVVMNFVVAAGTEAGAQAQSLNISYLQDGEQRQSSASISLTIEEVIEEEPLILLDAYSTDDDDQVLTPGQQFSFDMTLTNAGTVDIASLLLTFGTVQSTNGNSATGTATGDSNSVTITPSSDFVIYGSGGRAALGDLAAGDSIDLSQSFLVSSGLSSGIYKLPVTIQYTLADGTQTTQSLSASLMVVVLPNLRLTTSNTPEGSVIGGERVTFNVEITNLGEASVMLTEMRATGINIDVTEGEQIALDPIQGDDDTTESVTFIPIDEGEYEVTVEVDYIDGLNRIQTLSTTFSGRMVEAEVMQAPPWVSGEGTPQILVVEEEVSVGQLLLGFLGLGG